MNKPLIGLTTARMPNPMGFPAFGMNESFATAVSVAGGIPLLIPSEILDDDLEELLLRLDGILFTGGYDINPQRYGNPPHPKAENIDDERDRMEIQLVRASVEKNKPFFGICRGCQVINVALGGSLYEHLSEQLPGALHHDNHGKPRDYLAHAVKVERDSRLAQVLVSTQIKVNSLHHQGVRQLAPALQATAHTADGLVEAFELTKYPFGMAVQWHPEELQAYPAMRRLFQAFVQACKLPIQ